MKNFSLILNNLKEKIDIPGKNFPETLMLFILKALKITFSFKSSTSTVLLKTAFTRDRICLEPVRNWYGSGTKWVHL